MDLSRILTIVEDTRLEKGIVLMLGMPMNFFVGKRSVFGVKSSSTNENMTILLKCNPLKNGSDDLSLDHVFFV